MKRVTWIAVAAFILCGLFLCNGAQAGSEEGCKVTVEGGYAAAFDSDGERIEGIVPYGAVYYYWVLPKEKRIASFTVTEKKEDGSTESHTWEGVGVYYEEDTPDGKQKYRYYDYIYSDTEEVVVTAVIEDRTPAQPIVFDLREGICHTSEDGKEWDFIDLMELFRHEGVTAGEENITLADYDLDGDGSMDIGTASEGWFHEFEQGDISFSTGYIIPLAGRSVSGNVTVNLKVTPEETGYMNLYYYYGETVPVILRFGEEATKEKYPITVDGGYVMAYNPADGEWTKVTKAAPGTTMLLCPEAYEGKYVSEWKSDFWLLYGLKGSYYNDACVGFYMPAADVTFTAVMEKQTPYTIDLTGGFYRSDRYKEADHVGVIRDLRSSLKVGVFDERLWNYTYDVDGDGTGDILIYDFYPDEVAAVPSMYYVIPLSTCSLRGEYTLREPNTGEFWPITLRFGTGPVKEEYSVTVIGGSAEDMNRNPVTKAAPGTKVFFKTDAVISDDVWVHMSTTPDYAEFDSSWYYFGARTELVMPACDIIVTLETRKAGEDYENTPTPTAGPDETPTPTVSPEATKAPAEDGPTAGPELTKTPTDESPGKKHRKSSDSDDDEGISPLVIIIPVIIVLLAMAAGIFLWYRRNRNRNSD